MPHNNVKLKHQDDTIGPTRMATQSKNATTHPGAILQDAQRVRRTKEEINQEKELKNAQMEANLKKKATGEAYIAQLKEIEAAASANADNEFPRQKPKKGLR